MELRLVAKYRALHLGIAAMQENRAVGDVRRRQADRHQQIGTLLGPRHDRSVADGVGWKAAHLHVPLVPHVAGRIEVLRLGMRALIQGTSFSPASQLRSSSSYHSGS